MNYVTGTYRNGAVILDEPVDWPEGMRVQIAREFGESGGQADVCLDGSPWEDSPQAVRKWCDWFDSLEPVFTGEELERFEAVLRSVRAEQKALLPHWEAKIANLLK
ncbi:MAG: hypothetical protein HYY24_05820 [Verrucomicrobia bacterium]|nr:hypothetical protein [Verrucomicrobiota bacterium]